MTAISNRLDLNDLSYLNQQLRKAAPVSVDDPVDGRTFRELRERAGCSRIAAAQVLGSTYLSIYNFETGKINEPRFYRSHAFRALVSVLRGVA